MRPVAADNTSSALEKRTSSRGAPGSESGAASPIKVEVGSGDAVISSNVAAIFRGTAKGNVRLGLTIRLVMGGICGRINFDGRPVQEETLHLMAEAARHRAPDGVRYWTSGQAGLAHLALHVTPESPRERQPLAHGEDELVLTSDARVDNRKELIRRLSTGGWLAKKDPTDADLLLAAYQCWGADCPKHIIGDFAFVVWDPRKRQLFAARDPMGMRSLYYRRAGHQLLFATEVKQILAVPGVPEEVSERAVAAHLAGRFEALGSTFYEGIRQLPPGRAMTASEDGCHTRQYWEVDVSHRIRYADEREYAEHFLEIFKEAVRCRLRTSRPVGIFLSGGLDSGSVASTAGHLIRENEVDIPAFHTYSWAFEQLSQCDERYISDDIVGHYNLSPSYIPAEETYPLEDYPLYGPDKDEPFIGVHQAFLERGLEAAERDEVAVMLSGHRGDLMMGDAIYDYTGLFWRGEWRTLLRELQMQAKWRDASLKAMVRQFLVPPLLDATVSPEKAERVRQVLRRMRGKDEASLFPEWVSPALAERVDLRKEMSDGEAYLPPLEGAARRERYRLMFTPMHMRVATWWERTHAQYGIGFADPWGDQRIARFALAVPQRVLTTTEVPKRLTRRAMAGIMPESARQAARKISPGPLYEKALKERARDTVQHLIADSRAAERGYINESALHRYYEGYLGGGPEDYRFWYALCLEMWLRQHGK